MTEQEELLLFLEQVDQTTNKPESIFSQLLPLLVKYLQCDRCFLYLRHPPTKMGKVSHCWRRSPEVPELLDVDWKREPESLPQIDPLFAAALQAKPSIFVEDIETANSEVVNREFEQKTFGHRALIHAHLVHDGSLWAILQPCVFNHPRKWTTLERNIMASVEQFLTPFVVLYVNEHFSN